jgi:outer membrane lipoprotein carrier protein
VKNQPLPLPLKACLGLLILLAAMPLQAGDAIQRLQAFFATQGAIRGEFEQTVPSGAFSQPEKSHGTLVMQRPGKFRWDYRAPYEQVILADGQYLWIYDLDLEQVIVKNLDEALGSTPAVLLSGGSSLEARFSIEEIAGEGAGVQWVRLVPREAEPDFQELRLGFGPRHLAAMELVDGFGQLTRLDFSRMEEGVKVPEETFHFIPPEGVDVVGAPAVIAPRPLQPLKP